MSYPIADSTISPMHIEQSASNELAFTPRTASILLPFSVPLAISGLGFLSGGNAVLTDLSFLILTVSCGVMLALELFHFPRRFGMGGMVLFVGVLAWFSYDYMEHWFHVDFAAGIMPYSAAVISKTAYFHCLFIFCAVAGLLITPPQWTLRPILNIREAANSNFYFWIATVAMVIGLLPYALFNNDGFISGLYYSTVGGRSSAGSGWAIGRTGNANYSWGGYVVQLLQIGHVGALLGLFYALLIGKNPVFNAVCWAHFILQAMLSFGTGTRGFLAFTLLPLLFIWFIKYQSEAAVMLKRFSLKPYLFGGAVGLIIIGSIQTQIAFRNTGFAGAQLTDVNFTKLEGNSMFSEGLSGWALIPEIDGFFSNKYPGEALIRPLPETLWRFVIGPIPRALWNSKPFDEMLLWHKSTVTGSDRSNVEGTTVSTGLVGEWYFRYGWLGVVQGGLLFGFLLKWSEQILQESQGRILTLLFSLGLLTWLFRVFRNFSFADLYPFLVGFLFLLIATRLFGGSSRSKAYAHLETT